ncbi:MAG TPA: plastocyanin/azurin family copper-binding protein [Candidatus Limnocylindrales bacterium]|nr:plastocyanin/azurin family copper-binding protein [Candidatus Limnocylindrales bacterium]
MSLHGIHRILFSVVFAVVLAACSPADEDASPTDQEPRTLQVRMTDELLFEPDEFTVQVGETVRFEVTNAGQIVHEFLIGDEAAQDEFEMEMGEGNGMAHDSDAGVSVEPGETESFQYTFGDAGDLLAGCHEPGHYDGGMVATITVTD